MRLRLVRLKRVRLKHVRLKHVRLKLVRLKQYLFTELPNLRQTSPLQRLPVKDGTVRWLTFELTTGSAPKDCFPGSQTWQHHVRAVD